MSEFLLRLPFGSTLLTVSGVSASRGPRQVLEAVDLSVAAGELVALVGPNGAGKSSLLAAICGDIPITAGSIELNERPVEEWSPAELALRRAVMLQQSTVAFPFRSSEVVGMARAPWRRQSSATDDELAVERALVGADAVELADRPVTSLSGGEKARVALARLLAQDAQLLLLDEPTASLDISHQELVMSALRDRAAVGDGVVVVLHDLSLAAAYADRMAIIDHGRIVASGPPAQVATADVLAPVYRHPVEVLAHPSTGSPMIVAARHLPRQR